MAAASLQTNFLSTASLVTWLANYFSAQYHGTLVVLSSVAGDRGRKSNYIYGSAKAGLNAFLDGVRNRVDRDGVQVLTVRPGFVATPMTAHLPQGPLFATPEMRICARHSATAMAEHLPRPFCLDMAIIRGFRGNSEDGCTGSQLPDPPPFQGTSREARIMGRGRWRRCLKGGSIFASCF